MCRVGVVGVRLRGSSMRWVGGESVCECWEECVSVGKSVWGGLGGGEHYEVSVGRRCVCVGVLGRVCEEGWEEGSSMRWVGGGGVCVWECWEKCVRRVGRRGSIFENSTIFLKNNSSTLSPPGNLTIDIYSKYHREIIISWYQFALATHAETTRISMTNSFSSLGRILFNIDVSNSSTGPQTSQGVSKLFECHLRDTDAIRQSILSTMTPKTFWFPGK